MRRFLAVVVVLVATLGFAPAVAAASPAADSPAASAVRCEFIPTPDKPAAKPVRPPSPKAPARGTPTAVFATNYGVVVMELDRVERAVRGAQLHAPDPAACSTTTPSAGD